MMGNEADGADAAQEALVAIARGLARGRYDERSSFGTWAYRVATNACLDELRRRARRAEAVGDERLERALVDSRPPLETTVADRVDVDAAVRSLAPEFRAAVVLRDLCGLDYAEIAEVLAVPPGTVRSRIARGRATLASLLGNPGASADRPTATP